MKSKGVLPLIFSAVNVYVNLLGSSGWPTKLALLVDGVPTDGFTANRCHEESAGPSKIEKEEGELSPNGDFEDYFVAYGDTGLKAVSKARHSVESGQYWSGNGKVTS